MRFRIVGNCGKRLDNEVCLLEKRGLTLYFENLEAYGKVMKAYINGAEIFSEAFNDEITIPRSKLKKGILRVEIIYTDDSGTVRGKICCEPICVSSIYEQASEPLVCYTEMSELLDRLIAIEQDNISLKTEIAKETARVNTCLEDMQARINTLVRALNNPY